MLQSKPHLQPQAAVGQMSAALTPHSFTILLALLPENPDMSPCKQQAFGLDYLLVFSSSTT